MIISFLPHYFYIIYVVSIYVCISACICVLYMYTDMLFFSLKVQEIHIRNKHENVKIQLENSLLLWGDLQLSMQLHKIVHGEWTEASLDVQAIHDTLLHAQKGYLSGEEEQIPLLLAGTEIPSKTSQSNQSGVPKSPRKNNWRVQSNKKLSQWNQSTIK